MAKAVINLQKESGGIVKISPVDGIGITEVTVPESGELVTKDYVNSEIGVPNSLLVKTALNATGNAPIYACRAWANASTIGTARIIGSGNFSSLVDNGVGTATLNLTVAMPDASFSVLGAINRGQGNRSIDVGIISSFQINVVTTVGETTTRIDEKFSVSIFK